MARGQAKRDLAREECRIDWPKYLYEADVYLEYKRAPEAKERINLYLSDHPGDTLALALLDKANLMISINNGLPFKAGK